VRFCYGPDEIQRTRVQQIDYTYDGAAYDFYENFTLSVEPRPNVEFRVEVRDEAMGGDILGAVQFSEARLKRQFLRTKEVHLQEEDMSVADEQVVRMRRVRSMARTADDLKRQRMGEAGFIVHKLPDGGAVWLAFSDIYDEHMGLLSCCGV